MLQQNDPVTLKNRQYVVEKYLNPEPDARIVSIRDVETGELSSAPEHQLRRVLPTPLKKEERYRSAAFSYEIQGDLQEVLMKMPIDWRGC